MGVGCAALLPDAIALLPYAIAFVCFAPWVTGDRIVVRRRRVRRSLANSSAEWPRDAEALLATLALPRGWRAHNVDTWRVCLLSLPCKQLSVFRASPSL